MIPLHSLDQIKRHDGWLADARPTHGFKLAETSDKVKPPRKNSTLWEWAPVHRSEVSRMKQAYSNPDLTDPIRCSFLTLTTEVGDRGMADELVVDVEPCRTFHDSHQQLHTLWLGRQETIMQELRDGRISDALGIDRATGYQLDREQVYFDGRLLYRLPWPEDAELDDAVLEGAGAHPVNAARNLWIVQVSAVGLTAALDWSDGVPRQNSSLLVYRSNDDHTLWGHTPALSLLNLSTTANLMIGNDGMDDLDRDLTLTLDFALDAARVVGKWCGPASVDALDLPKAMVALNTVNLSNLHPSERALTPIGMGFSQATIWLMGRSMVCQTPEQCIDFRNLYTDLFMRRSCMSANRIEVRKKKTADREIPLMDAASALKAAEEHIAKREKSRIKRRAGLVEKAKAAAAEREREHAERLGARRRRRGNGRNRLASTTQQAARRTTRRTVATTDEAQAE